MIASIVLALLICVLTAIPFLFEWGLASSMLFMAVLSVLLAVLVYVHWA